MDNEQFQKREKKISQDSTSSYESSTYEKELNTSSTSSDSGLSGLGTANTSKSEIGQEVVGSLENLDLSTGSDNHIRPDSGASQCGQSFENLESLASSSPVPRQNILNEVVANVSKDSSSQDRRTQSLEVLSQDFNEKMSLLKGKKGDVNNPVRHAHFADDVERSKGVSSPALSAPPAMTISYRQMPKEARIRKSMSIPVHLTVSKDDCSSLPYSLRPEDYEDYGNDVGFRPHDRDCAISIAARSGYENARKSTQTQITSGNNKTSMWRRSKTPSNSSIGSSSSSSIKQRSSSSARTKSRYETQQGLKSSKPISVSTTALRPLSTNEMKRPIKPNQQQISNRKPPTGNCNERRPLKATEVLLSSSSEESKPKPINGYERPTKSSTLRTRKKRKVPPAMNAELQIWEIQRELKRGEMVQGVLQLGPRTHHEDACICAPVTIARTDGHMHWRSM